MSFDMKSVEIFVEKRGFRTERMKRVEGAPFEAALYGFREGHSLWKLFPFEDHFFFYDFSESGRNNAANLQGLHDSARAWVDSRFKVPRWRRYRVPNIVTVAFSGSGFSDDMKKLVSKHAPYGVGGEKHSMYLIDTSEKRLYSAGIERTRGSAVIGGTAASVSIAPANVNPVNRAYHLLSDMMKEIF